MLRPLTAFSIGFEMLIVEARLSERLRRVTAVHLPGKLGDPFGMLLPCFWLCSFFSRMRSGEFLFLSGGLGGGSTA